MWDRNVIIEKFIIEALRDFRYSKGVRTTNRGMSARFSVNQYSNWRQLSTQTALAKFSVKDQIYKLIQRWEDFFGLTAVRIAQEEVIQCENRLHKAQKQRRAKQYELKQLQSRLKDIHSELDRTSRGDDRFLHLLTEEHAAIKSERALLQEFEEAEAIERETFQALSARVRSSHEKERERVEKNKYLSLWATVTGAIFGVIGTTMAAELRMRRIKELIPTAAQITPVLEQVRELVEKQHSQAVAFISDFRDLTDRKVENSSITYTSDRGHDTGDSVEKLLCAMGEQNAILTREMDELKRIIAVDRCHDVDLKDVVYVGSDMRRLLNQSEKNLERNLFYQNLFFVAVAVLPLAVSFLKGN